MDNLTGVMFFDAGMLGNDAFEFATPRASTGLGLRLFINGAEVGGDIAIPILSGKDDQNRYFHFNLSSLKGF